MKVYQNLLKNRYVYRKAIFSSFFGFLLLKKEMTGRQHIVEATSNFLLIEVKFPTFLKASQYLNINSVLKMHNNTYASPINCHRFLYIW